jgi:hypothetical protein
MATYWGGLPTSAQGYGGGSIWPNIGNVSPLGKDPFSEIAIRTGQMAPLTQYQAALARMNPAAGQYQQQAAMQGFNPAYAMYEAFGMPGTEDEQYGDFSSYLASAMGQAGQSQADVRSRMWGIAAPGTGFTDADLAGQVQQQAYYGDDPEELKAQRLATAEAMGALGGNRMNPMMQRAMGGVIDRMYNAYLGSAAYQSPTPGGFMDYYLRQRGIADVRPGGWGSEVA